MEDVRNKTSKANGAFNQLQEVWKSSDISLRTNLRLFSFSKINDRLYGLVVRVPGYISRGSGFATRFS
jgi:hypothetical protein